MCCTRGDLLRPRTSVLAKTNKMWLQTQTGNGCFTENVHDVTEWKTSRMTGVRLGSTAWELLDYEEDRTTLDPQLMAVKTTTVRYH